MSSAAVRSEAMRLVDGVLASSAPVYDVLALGGFVASVGGNRGAGNIKKLLVWRPPQQQQPANSPSAPIAPASKSGWARR